MAKDPDLDQFIALLRSPEASTRSIALRTLLARSSGEPELLSHLEALLSDRTPALLGLPFMFGELRALAAEVLGRERALQGISAPVEIASVPKPLRANQLAELRREAGVQSKPGVEGELETYRILRDAGKIPARNIYRDPATFKE